MSPPIKEYRSLLTAEESIPSLERSIALVQKLLGGAFTVANGVIQFVPGKRHSGNGASAFKRPANSLGPLFSSTAEMRPKSKADLRSQKVLLDSSLILFTGPGFTEQQNLSEKTYSFQMDSYHLVFRHACFGLLPELPDGWTNERELLLAACQHFAESQHRASDRFHYLGACAEARGDLSAAGDFYVEEVAATPPDAHEFMTSLQIAWGCLLDQGRTWDALAFLKENSGRITRPNWDEFMELFIDTCKIAAPQPETAASEHQTSRQTRERVIDLD
jgi:hypothetical protein